jgi:hypothetical protein
MMNISSFLLKSFFGFILFLSFNATSQQQYAVICTMDQRQIMQSQSFTEDAIEAEEASALFLNFTNTLVLAYNNINNSSMQALAVQISAIQTHIQAFQTLGLNYSMFNDDIEFILNYN